MHKLVVAWGLAGTALLSAAAAQAQSDVPARVGKLEAEMRAVQRKVFPNGAGQYLQPEVSENRAPTAVPGTPSSSAMVDLSSRVTSLEGQMARLTDQTEQNGYKLRQLQDLFDTYRRSTDAKLAAMGTAGPPAAAARDTGDEPAAVSDMPTPSRRTPAKSAPAVARPTRDTPTAVDEAAVAGKPVATAGLGATASVARPSTGDAAEDDYLYGYRLWQAKQYPAAEAQLKKVVATYPNSKRASFAQNLLGRSYLDEGKPSLASMAFYDNYKKMPDGERAPDSLYYLAQALMKLNKPADACKVYGELTDVYGAKISGGMKADVAKGRAAAKCQ